MLVPLSWLRDFVDIDISVNDLSDKLTQIGFEVEGINITDDDTVLSIKVTSNRGDCLSIFGIAKEICVILNKKIKLPQFSFKETGEDISNLVSIEIENKDLCPRYSSKIIKNIKVQPSPSFIQKHLISAGIKPKNNIVDITNYVCLEFGQPLHAFDYDTLQDKKIIVRCAKDEEKIITLDGEERTLTPDMLVIADAKRAIAIAGVIGGSNTEITEKTSSVLLESAHFQPESIRKTSKKLGISTEASYRFERWVDPEGTIFALKRATDLILKSCNGIVCKGEVDIYPNIFQKKEILFRPARCYFLLGGNIKEDEIKSIFEKLQFEIKEEKDNCFKVVVPTYRKDISLEVDLIEEIARIFGYNNIETTMPVASLAKGKQTLSLELEDDIRNFFVSCGLTEVITHSLEKADAGDEFTFFDNAEQYSKVILKNPYTPDYARMRTSVLPSLLDVIKNNFSQQIDNISIFEMGKIYSRCKDEFKETKVISCALCGSMAKNLWSKKKCPLSFDYFYLKGMIEKFFEKFGINDFKFYNEKLPAFHPNVCAGIKIKDKKIGIIGELSQDILRKWDIQQKVYCVELNMSEILQFINQNVKYKSISRFPCVRRDIAIVVDRDVMFDSILSAINDLDIDILEKVDLFDEYMGYQIPEGKKSLALSFVYRHKDKTLSGDEINIVQEEIIKKLKDEFNIEIRR